jgi:hypothetical protein
MQGLHGQFGWFRLVIALAVLGQLPAAASADLLFTEIYTTPLKIVWATPLVPADAVPGYSGEGLQPVSTDLFSNELFVSGPREPGLQFSLDPVEEEVFLGWRFKF